jgi:transposase
VAHRAWLRSQRFEWPALQQTFAAYLRAREGGEAHLAVLDQQVVDLAQQAPYRTLVQALRCLKGIDTLSAVTLAVEAQEFRRFPRARAFMSYTGAVSMERSSGGTVRRGSITKAGNAHLRRILVEAAWSARHGTGVSPALTARRKGCPAEVVRIAKKAQARLHRTFWRLTSRTKPAQVAVVAVARELAGFVWAIAHQVPEGGSA